MTIARRLYLVLGIMLLLISAELCALLFTINTLSAVRAYVAGEGLWSKAEKDAAYHLEAYGRTRAPKEYQAYRERLRVGFGDQQARLELAKAKPDPSRASEGFLHGGNDLADIPGMISLFQRFGKISYIAQAIADWTAGDALMTRFEALGSQLYAQVRSRKSDAVVAQTLLQIADVNAQMTVIEDHFSATLGEGSRWLTGLVIKILVGAALLVELTGLLLTAAITRRISVRLKAMLHASERVSQGDYSVTLDENRNDEIGRLAASFNKMTQEIERERQRAADAVLASETSLREAQRVAHIGGWEWNFESDAMSWSREVCRLHGAPSDAVEISYARFIHFVHPEDTLRGDQIVRASRWTGKPFVLDYRVLLSDGAVRWLCAEARVERDASDDPFRMLGTTRDITERKRLEFLAQNDPLTNLLNRPALVDRLNRAMIDASRTHGVAALLFLDLDHFKHVNDTLGHAAGDRLLAAVAERLKSRLRSSDTIARHGGDEFLIALTELPHAETAGHVAHSILAALAQPFLIDNEEVSMTASIGISLFPHDGDDPESLIRVADKAMYHAKVHGRNNVRFYSERTHEQAAVELSFDLKALASQESPLAIREGALAPDPSNAGNVLDGLALLAGDVARSICLAVPPALAARRRSR